MRGDQSYRTNAVICCDFDINRAVEKQCLSKRYQTELRHF